MLTDVLASAAGGLVAGALVWLCLRRPRLAWAAWAGVGAAGGVVGVTAYAMAIDYPLRTLPPAAERATPELALVAAGVGVALGGFWLLQKTISPIDPYF